MTIRAYLTALTFLAGSAAAAGTAGAANEAPTVDSRPLSELLGAVEQRQDFLYIDELEWEDGEYEIRYVTRNGEKEEIDVDPVTGEIRN